LTRDNILALVDFNEELELLVLNTIDPDNSSLREGEVGLTTGVFQIIHSEELNVVEVLLRTILRSQVAQSI